MVCMGLAKAEPADAARWWACLGPQNHYKRWASGLSKRPSAESQLGFDQEAVTAASQRAAPIPMTRPMMSDRGFWDDLRITAPAGWAATTSVAKTLQ